MEPETLHESSTRQKFHSYCLYLLVPAINIPRLVFQFFVVVPPRLGTGKKNECSNECFVNYGQNNRLWKESKIHIFFCQWFVIHLSSIFFSLVSVFLTACNACKLCEPWMQLGELLHPRNYQFYFHVRTNGQHHSNLQVSILELTASISSVFVQF